MTTKLSNACSKYGADMGRHSCHAGDRTLAVKLRLEEVRLDYGGYDNGGAYWGTGKRLYRAEGENTASDRIEWFFRASDREDAKNIIRQSYSNARFYR